ncbi:MAG: hypothetical protein LBD09_07215 [Treponema sp.]|jgi:hypothetical protein|nr:hypothetical protein [Treponema sp.]
MAGKTKTAKQSAEWETLAKELRGLIPKLDEEGLAFLVEQAQVHLYNLQVEALNTTLAKNQERAAKAAAGKSGKTAAGKSAGGGFSEIKVSESGSSYYIVYKTEWIMFSKDEMIKLVNISGGEGTELDIKERLYNWLSRERSDLLRSAGIAEKFDPKLASLAGLLKKTFKVRK